MPILDLRTVAQLFRLSELDDVCGIEGASNAERANRFILWIEDMNREMGLPTCLDMIKEQDIPQMNC